MEFKDRLKAARRQSKLTQLELAAAVGISQTSITDLERGKSQSTSYVAEIAKACGVDPLWLATGKGDLDLQLSDGTTVSVEFKHKQMHENIGAIGAENSNVLPVRQPHKEVKEYPLISWVAAGCWEESCDNFNPGDADEWLKSDANAGPHGYWLEVKGPSMLPTFSPGMRILIKPENFDLISGKYYIAKLLDTGETTFKQYLRDGGSSYLQPLNQAFPVIPITENVAIIGMVVDAKLPSSLF